MKHVTQKIVSHPDPPKNTAKYNGWRRWGDAMSKTDAEYKAKRLQKDMDETSAGKGYWQFRAHKLPSKFGYEVWEVQQRTKAE